MESKTYILKKDCPNIGKEVGDYYNGEYGDSLEKITDLVARGVIEEEVKEVARTPREAKQEFLNDLIAKLRSVLVIGQSFADFKAQNVKAITEVAEKHGLTIPPKV